MRSTTALTVFGLAGAICLCIAALVRPGDELPPGVTRLDTVTGAEATAMVDRLHGRSVTPLENSISRYEAPGGLVTVYSSTYDSDSLARAVAERMRDRIKTIGYGFSNYAEIREAGVLVARCAGQGRIHYFFAASHRVTWVDAEPAALPAAWALVVRSLKMSR
jgi:hypothetical protein